MTFRCFQFKHVASFKDASFSRLSEATCNKDSVVQGFCKWFSSFLLGVHVNQQGFIQQLRSCFGLVTMRLLGFLLLICAPVAASSALGDQGLDPSRLMKIFLVLSSWFWADKDKYDKCKWLGRYNRGCCIQYSTNKTCTSIMSGISQISRFLWQTRTLDAESRHSFSLSGERIKLGGFLTGSCGQEWMLSSWTLFVSGDVLSDLVLMEMIDWWTDLQTENLALSPTCCGADAAWMLPFFCRDDPVPKRWSVTRTDSNTGELTTIIIWQFMRNQDKVSWSDVTTFHFAICWSLELLDLSRPAHSQSLVKGAQPELHFKPSSKQAELGCWLVCGWSNVLSCSYMKVLSNLQSTSVFFSGFQSFSIPHNRS